MNNKKSEMKRILFSVLLIASFFSGTSQTLYKLGGSVATTTVDGNLFYLVHPTYLAGDLLRMADKKYVDDAIAAGGGAATLQIVVDNGNTTLDPIIFTAAGTGRNIGFTNSSTTDNFAVLSAYPSTGTNVGAALAVIPRGTGYIADLKAQLSIFNTDFNADQTNYEALIVRAAGTEYSFNVIEGGTGVLRPFSIQMNGTEYFEVGITGGITLASLAGNGTGVVAVDNNGLLSFSAGSGGSNWTVESGSTLSRSSPIRVGSSGVPSEELHLRVDQNDITRLLVENNTNGTAARAELQVLNNGGFGVLVGSYSAGHTPTDALVAGVGYLFSNTATGMTIMQAIAGQPMRFASGGTVEGMQLNGNNELQIGSVSDLGAFKLQVTGNAITDNLKITGGSPGLGKLAQSDADGDISFITYGLQQVLDAGSTLSSDETITVGTNLLTITGSETVNIGVVNINNTSSGPALIANANGGSAIYGIATSGIGGNFSATSGTAVNARATTGIAALYIVEPATTNTVTQIAQFQRLTSGTAANGIGLSFDFGIETTDGTAQLGSKITTQWTDATTASRTASLSFATVNNAGSLTDRLTIAGSGLVTINSSQLNIATQYTPSSSTDTNFPEKTITIDDTFLYYRTSGGTWKKIAWVTF